MKLPVDARLDGGVHEKALTPEAVATRAERERKRAQRLAEIATIEANARHAAEPLINFISKIRR